MIWSKFKRFKISPNRRLLKKRGQVSIMVAIMMLIFFQLFGFVVGTGNLITAKINLQNAADLAAYAGAAVQARQLNQISMLNYEMRRQIKKFLFRYYVLGNMAQDSHNTDIAQGLASRTWAPSTMPGDPQAGVSYGVPAVCMIFNARDNFCRRTFTAAIQRPQTSALDSLSTVLDQQAQQLERLRQENCAKIAIGNNIVLVLWLYNTDPELTNIVASLSAQNPDPNDKTAITIQSIQGIAQGLGLVPRMILNSRRIKTLDFYLKFLSEEPLNIDVVSAFRNSADPARRERSIAAFMSAYNTLGAANFPSDGILMEELLPTTTDAAGNPAANVSGLREHVSDFETYYVRYPDVDGLTAYGSPYPRADLVPPVGNPTNCAGFPQQVQVRGLPVGFSKDPSILTYYAVRLTAKARLLYGFPGLSEDIEMTAYSAAMPFGSRIGPPPNHPTVTSQEGLPFVNSFLEAVNPQQVGNNICAAADACKGVINLGLERREGPDGLQNGWNRPDVINTFYQELLGAGAQQLPGGGTAPVLGVEDMERAFHSAMAPNIAESGVYNIPYEADAQSDDTTHSRGGDKFKRYFDDNLVYSFWAPLFPPEDLEGNPDDRIAEVLQDLVQGPQTFKDELVSNMSSYIGRTRDCDGERVTFTRTGSEVRECFNLAQLPDPLRRYDRNGQIETAKAGSFLMDNIRDINTSWAEVRGEEYRERGRSGYSVKFVSFETLMNPNGVSSTNQADLETSTEWENTPPQPGVSGREMTKLKH